MAVSIQIVTEEGSLDLEKGAEALFYVTRQIHDLHNFETRNADYTKNLSVPATPQNIRILDAYTGAAGTVRSTVPCQIIMEGITISPRAQLLFLDSVVSNEEVGYRVTILFGNFNLFESLKAGTIDNMAWADLAYDMSDAVWITNTGSQNATDLVTPICDWVTRGSGAILNGDGGTPSINLELNVMGFFIYVKEVIKRIIEEAGYTVVYAPSIPAQFYILALACPVTKRFEIESVDSLSFSNSVDTDPDVNIAQDGTFRCTFGTIINNSSGWWQPLTNEWLADQTQEITITLTGIYSHQVIGTRPDSEIRIMHNGAPVATLLINGTVTDVDYYLTAQVSAVAGDLIYIELFSAVPQSILTLPAKGSIFKVSTPGVDPSPIVQPSEHIPQLDKGEFIVNILKVYNLIMRTDDISKVVTIQSFNDIYSAKEQDLSTLLDAGLNKIEIGNSLDSLGQQSWFKWKEDNLLRRDANYVIQFDNQLLSKEKDTITLEFSACDNSLLHFDTNTDLHLKAKIPSADVSVDALGDVLIVFQTDGSFVITDGSPSFNVGDYFGIATTGSPASPARYNRVIEKNSPTTGYLQTPVNPTQVNSPTPLLYVKKVSANNPEPRLALVALDGGGGEATYFANNGGPYGSSPTPERDAYKFGLSLTATWQDSLRWQELIPDHYNNIMKALQTPEVIKAWFNIPTALFVQLDFMKPVYINKFNSFYYINKINQFKPQSKVQLELIRINSLTTP